MKRIAIALLACSLSFGMFAQNDLLLKANEQYTKEQFKEAINSYQELLMTGLESPEVYFNLGNAYYKTGQHTLAILNYERAKLLSADDEDIDFNLQVANQYVVDSIQELPGIFIVNWWNGLINSQTTDRWAVISIISFLFFLSLAGLFLFAKTGTIRRLAFWVAIVFFLISGFSWSFAGKQKSRLVNHSFAIVTQPTVAIKSSPSEKGTNLFIIHEGLKIQIVDKLGDWVEIKLANGNKGWLMLDAIEKI
jgi:tetratricopeptide (TPR) repeat protein